MIMRCESRHAESTHASDTAERRQPRSLDLALRRMGFRDQAEASLRRGPLATWQRRPEDPAPDWRPL